MLHIKIKVKTDCDREEVTKKGDDLYHVSLKEPAERGMANGKLVALMKDLYPGKVVKIVSGHHKSAKLMEVGD